MAKITIKEKVLRFVEKRGTASFSEIQEFIVDMKFGKGTYKRSAGTSTSNSLEYNQERGYMETKRRPANPYRGYFSSAFSGSVKWSSRYPNGKRKEGYFLTGPNRLEKLTNGKYTTIRDNKQTPPFVSDDFQIGPNGAYEHVDLYTKEEVMAAFAMFTDAAPLSYVKKELFRWVNYLKNNNI